MDKTIGKALFNSHSYIEYRKIVTDLLRENKSTGNEQSDALTHYSSLNESRMNRLEKTMKILPEVASRLQALEQEYIWIVISEGWCGDAAQLLPIFDKMAEQSNGKIELRIVLRDENEELMNHFLTNKAKSIPKLIVINKATSGALAHWGPRPNGAVELIANYKKVHGVIDETLKADLQLWYLHDKGVATQSEVIDMMLDLDQTNQE